jgi:serine/threonine protein kinase
MNLIAFRKVSKEAQDLIIKMLHKDPNQRITPA